MTTAASKRTKAGASRPSNGRPPSSARELLAHPNVVPIVSLTAFGKLFAGWAESADRYAQAVSDEFVSRAHHGTNVDELLERLAAISKQHFKELSALPKDVVEHFRRELTRQTNARPSRAPSGGRKPRRRRSRADAGRGGTA
jgi:hypothetical protein